ncbi:MAG TPA: alpha-amylase family glycosyl hydrolase [Gaiellaceae bacterium]|nr:alpha-amylase family glycosyl hydrolase [Gaiellaceae bacterium]
MASVARPWWQRAVLYQVYVRSFADSDSDGVGDLRGIVDRLEYLQWLGVDALWLSPVTVSPDKDWGYDVADYTDVQAAFGGMPALDELVAEAGARDLHVIIDIVPNHTSDRHPWFQESRASRNSPRRDWYVWADPKQDGSPPNNWRSTFLGAPAWTLDDRTGQYYLHNFLPEQPDLNWWNDDVRAAFDAILRFWLDRGIDGFRIDVAHGIVKDRELRDNPDPSVSTYNANREDVHDVLRRWRRLVDAYAPERVLLGETWVMDLRRLAGFYGNGADELHLAFNFPFTFSELNAEQLRSIVETTESLLPHGAWPVWMLSNHDIARFPTRMAGGDERKARALLFLLFTLRGTPVLYYGDELGMPQAEIPRGSERDMDGRDGARTPLPWNGGWNDPWLPLTARVASVAEQRASEGSFLSYCRGLIAQRRANPDLVDGDYQSLPSPDGVWAFRRGEHTRVAVNLTDDDAEGDDGLRLAPWQGIVQRR